MAVSFTKYQDDITRAWREVVDSASTPKWALFTYEGSANVIKLMATGQEGLDELVEEFNCSLIQYAFCRVIDEALGLNKLILINWQGDSAPLSRKGLCASHVGEVANYFKGCTQTITLRNDDEATKQHIMEQILKTSASKLGLFRQQHQHQPSTTTTTTTNTNNGPTDVLTRETTNGSNGDDTLVGSSISSASSVYKKVEIGNDIAASRKSFWQRQEEEEKERLAEEKRRAAEKQAQFEKERKQREEKEAKKLAETIMERDRLIEATKKSDKQAASKVGHSEVSTGASGDSAADDDGRVGRRSELIRLERNQETQSLISKGLIKNKRAIFEQAQAAQQQQQNQQPTLSRRSSGAMIAKRVNAFKSMDSSSTISPTNITNDGSTTSSVPVQKLTESFNNQVSLNEDASSQASPEAVVTSSSSPAVPTTTTAPASITTTVKQEMEPVKLTRESDETVVSNSTNVTTTSPTVESSVKNDDAAAAADIPEDQTPADSALPATPKAPAQPTNGVKKVSDVSQDDNGNIDESFSKKSPAVESPVVARSATPTDVITNEELIMNGKNSSIKAMALYDYQAADNTEISFDPDDQIGHIQKVDPGWWHGHVISGRFKGQIGLFPANYVEELQD